jgi:hypothetical protein
MLCCVHCNFVRCHGDEIMSENKPLCAMAIPFLTMDSDRVAYVDHWAWSVSIQMALVAVYD